MSGLFIAGAGTDVGKTWVAAGLVRAWRDGGRRVRAYKPLASGLPSPEDPAFADSDAGRLLTAQGLPLEPSAIADCSPWRFAAALSPDMAAAAEGRAVEMAEVAAWARARAAEAQGDVRVVVEGVGGVMSPIAEAATNLDLAIALGFPVLLVCGSYLGAISHGLTALAAVASAGLRAAAVVVNESEGSTVDFAETCRTFARFAGATPVHGLRRGEAATPGAFGLS